MPPRDVAMLARVFDDARRCHRFRENSEEAKEMALRLLTLFNAGMVEEAELRNVMSVRPRSGPVASS